VKFADKQKNQHSDKAIHSKKSKIKLFIIPTNEELEIAMQTERVVNG
jgi:acetate kinase